MSGRAPEETAKRAAPKAASGTASGGRTGAASEAGSAEGAPPAGRRWWLWLVAGALLASLAAGGLFRVRWYVVRAAPFRHSGVVDRVAGYHKDRAVIPWGREQGLHFGVVFKDGFNCEGVDPAFSTVRPGDTVEMFGYPDVFGWPVLDPEWGECGEGQLVQVKPP